MLLAHLSDLHLAVDGPSQADVDVWANAVRSVDAVARLGADAVLVTGDLAAHGEHGGAEAVYGLVAELFGRISLPVCVVPGNHDDPDRLAEWSGVGRNRTTGHFDHVAELPGGVTVVLLDSSRPGRVDGTLSAAQLSWCDGVLDDVAGPCLVALHHQPFPLAVGHLDGVALDAPGRSGLAEVIGAHAVERVLCGHVHRHCVTAFAQTVAVSAPSSAYAFALDLVDGPTRVVGSAPNVVVHHIDAHGTVSHCVGVDDPPPVLYRR